METLETERLLLRPWLESDLDDFYEYARDPEVGPNAGWEPHADKSVSTGILRSFIEKGEVWALQLKENGKVIGSLGPHAGRDDEEPDGRSCMVGYVLSRDFWGCGLMTEAVLRSIRYAFEELGLEHLTVFHFPFNGRSRRVIEKCGFRYTGTRHASFTDYRGEKLDEVGYALTCEEYSARKAD
jgi:[ribosomal protein S5]-alanine N-acetyltransferase